MGGLIAFSCSEMDVSDEAEHEGQQEDDDVAFVADFVEIDVPEKAEQDAKDEDRDFFDERHGHVALTTLDL